MSDTREVLEEGAGVAAVQPLLRFLLKHWAGEAKRYEALAQSAKRTRDILIRYGYRFGLGPRELSELTGMGESTVGLMVAKDYELQKKFRQRHRTGDTGELPAVIKEFEEATQVIDGLREGEV